MGRHEERARYSLAGTDGEQVPRGESCEQCTVGTAGVLRSCNCLPFAGNMARVDVLMCYT